MTREQAIDIAKNLTDAVIAGHITEVQARNRFKVVAAKYKQKDRFVELQKKNPKLWMLCAELLGTR